LSDFGTDQVDDGVLGGGDIHRRRQRQPLEKAAAASLDEASLENDVGAALGGRRGGGPRGGSGGRPWEAVDPIR
jgi:hypothetical protein